LCTYSLKVVQPLLPASTRQATSQNRPKGKALPGARSLPAAAVGLLGKDENLLPSRDGWAPARLSRGRIASMRARPPCLAAFDLLYPDYRLICIAWGRIFAHPPQPRHLVKAGIPVIQALSAQPLRRTYSKHPHPRRVWKKGIPFASIHVHMYINCLSENRRGCPLLHGGFRIGSNATRRGLYGPAGQNA
jgi:hypothetical protein